MLLPNLEEFGQCLDQVVIEYNLFVETNKMVLDDKKE